MMAWVRYCLRFADEAEFRSLMPAAWQAPSSMNHECCVIGSVYHVDTKTNGLALSTFLSLLGSLLMASVNLGNGTSKVVSQSQGFHANLCLKDIPLPTALVPKLVSPATPKYVWT